MSLLHELLLNLEPRMLTWTRRGAGRSKAIASSLLFSLASCQGVRPQFTGRGEKAKASAIERHKHQSIYTVHLRDLSHPSAVPVLFCLSVQFLGI